MISIITGGTSEPIGPIAFFACGLPIDREQIRAHGDGTDQESGGNLGEFVLSPFPPAGRILARMSDIDDLTDSIASALRRAIPAAGGRRLDEGRRLVAARLIAEHLHLCGYSWTRRPPVGDSGPGLPTLAASPKNNH